MQDAEATATMDATTASGGTQSVLLGDAFDEAPAGRPATADQAYVYYNQTAAAATRDCGERQLGFPNKLAADLTMSRRV